MRQLLRDWSRLTAGTGAGRKHARMADLDAVLARRSGPGAGMADALAAMLGS